MVQLSKERGKKKSSVVLAYNCGDILVGEKKEARIYVGFTFTNETNLVSSAIITSKLIKFLFLIKYLLFV